MRKLYRLEGYWYNVGNNIDTMDKTPKRITVERSFKQKGDRGTGKVTEVEKAEMMRTLLEKPEITVNEFARSHGYKVKPGTTNGSAHRMMSILKEQLSNFEIPEKEDLIKADMVLLALAQGEQISRISRDPESVSMGELTQAGSAAFKRASMLSGVGKETITVKIEEVKGMKEEDLDQVLTEMITVKEVKKKG